VQVYAIGSPLFWRRAAGDLWRRWRRRDASAGEVDFNPVRRAVALDDAPEAGLSAGQTLPRAYVERCATLVAAVRACDSEFLPASVLAANLPFAIHGVRAGRAGFTADAGSRDATDSLVAPLR
jgi:hypothetical protein